MSQIDKLNYLPLLFWFLIFFVYLYFCLFTNFLPLIFSALKTRALFFNGILGELFLLNRFFFFVVFLVKGLYAFNFASNFVLSFFSLESYFFKVNVSSVFSA